MSRKIKSNSSLIDFLETLVSKGQYHFTTKEILGSLKIQESSLSVSLSRLAKKGRIKMIRVGFGIILNPKAGELHPSFYIDKMMKYLNTNYYVGLLSAAAYWGASHQSSMSYQIIVDKEIKPIKYEKGRVEFAPRKLSFSEIGVQKVAGVGGYFLISSPELTAIDLLRFPKRSGHLNNIATILEDLVEKWDKRKMISLCQDSHIPTVSLQRLGFLLDCILKKPKEAKYIEFALQKRNPMPAVLSSSKKDGKSNKSYPFNSRWKLYINTEVEAD